jgi:hypothetical protein
MDKDDRQEIELEQELDSLYRKVAGLVPPEDSQRREETGYDRKTFTHKGSRPAAPAAKRPSQRKGRTSFRIAIIWGLLCAAFFLTMIALFSRATVDRHPTAASGGSDDPQGSYAVQIRAYPEDQKQNAITFLEDIRRGNPDVSLETVSIPGSGVWHRILLGDFSSEEEAVDYRQSRGVAREHPYSFIQKKTGK